MQKRRLAWVLLSLGLMVVGCADDDDPGPTLETPPLPEIPAEIEDLRGSETVNVKVQDNEYRPETLWVDPGTEIVFENVGLTQHNFVLVDENSVQEGFSEDVFGSGDTVTIVAEQVGRYPFYCSIHGTPTNGQRGFLLVGDT